MCNNQLEISTREHDTCAEFGLPTSKASRDTPAITFSPPLKKWFVILPSTFGFLEFQNLLNWIQCELSENIVHQNWASQSFIHFSTENWVKKLITNWWNMYRKRLEPPVWASDIKIKMAELKLVWLLLRAPRLTLTLKVCKNWPDQKFIAMSECGLWRKQTRTRRRGINMLRLLVSTLFYVYAFPHFHAALKIYCSSHVGPIGEHRASK